MDPTSTPTPTPSPNPSPTPSPKVPTIPLFVGTLFGNLIGPLLVAAALIGYDQFFRSHPVQPLSPIVVAAKDYVKTLPDAYESAAQQVKNGTITDKTNLVNSLRMHAKPLADAMDAAFAPLIDKDGKILNAAAASDMLDQVSKALGGK